MEKVGIMGGTFDPVHLGHIGLALDAKEQMKLDNVTMVPAKLQPFKLDKKVTSGKERLEMLELATEGLEGIHVSACELDSDKISYTYNTMEYMEKVIYPGCRLFFVSGTDTFLKIHKWYRADDFLSKYAFIVGNRPGYKEEELSHRIDIIRKEYNTAIYKIHNEQIDVSATDLRKELKESCKASCYLPEKVERYIKDHGLYR